MVRTRPEFGEHGTCITFRTQATASNGDGETVAEFDDKGQAYREDSTTTTKIMFTKSIENITKAEITMEVASENSACDS